MTTSVHSSTTGSTFEKPLHDLRNLLVTPQLASLNVFRHAKRTKEIDKWRDEGRDSRPADSVSSLKEKKGIAMKRFSLMLLAVGALAVVGTEAMAGDGYYGRRAARANHDAHHDNLEHRSYHRELQHRDAHRYPMSRRGHGRLHDNLEHDAYHDRLEHRSAHRRRAYSPYRRYRDRRYNRRGFSFRFGF